MVNFTNLKSKALSLVALMALSSTVGFAQGYGNSKFGDATEQGALTTAKKIFLYDGTSDKYSSFPFDSNAGLVKGVSLAVQQTAADAIVSGTGVFNTANDANVGDLAFSKIAPESPNDLNASYWYNNSKMNVFTRKNAATVVFDFSTKYLRNVRNLKMTLGENRMGSTPTLTTDWTVTTYVYNLDGTAVPAEDIYVSQNGNTNPYFSLGTVITTGTTDGVADKTITLFVNDRDNNTEDLIPYAIDNKIIRVVLTSKVPTEKVSGGHFLPALTISNCGIEFEKPAISVAADNLGEFNAGKCFISKQKGNLTFVAENVTGAYNVDIKHSKPVDFIEDDALTTFKYKDEADAAKITLSTVYDFQPKTITSGSFTYVAGVNADGLDPLSPIVLMAETEAIAYNSVPELYLAEDHIKYNDSENEEKDVTVTGKNIPCIIPNYTAYEKWTTDQREPYAKMVVAEHFGLDTDGTIISIEAGKPAHLHLDFTQMKNDLSRDEAFVVAIDNDWVVADAFGTGKDFKGETFPTLIARGNVAQLWFTYNGQSVIGTPSITPDNVFFSRHDPSQPYDDARYASRVKTFMLHGSDVTAQAGANNIATIAINLEVGALNTAGQDHLEMRFSLKDPASAGFTSADWTNATIKTLEYKLNTASAADVQNFYTNGIPVYVQYVPRCDGFAKAATAEAGFEYGWNPHEFQLIAGVKDGSSNHGTADHKTATVVNLYGDTRAALSSNMNEINSLYVMGGTQSVSPIGDVIKDWMTGAQVGNIIVPSFRKAYGDMYLGCENNLYWKVDSFVVAGYNLKQNVSLTQTHNTAYQNAFSTEVKILAGDATKSNATTLVPNEFGELVAVVKVYFAKNPVEKKANAVKAEDVLKVSTTEKTLVMTGQDKRVGYVAAQAKPYYNFFKIGGNVNNTPNVAHNTVNGFNYTAYSESAEVFGFIYKPTLSIEFLDTQDMVAAVGGNQVSQFWVRGSEFNPMNSKTVNIGVAKANTPFAVAPVVGYKAAAINNAGSFAELYQVTYAPTKANLCAKENTIKLGAQCATEVTADVTGTPTWNETAGFNLNPLNFGDIHGSMAKINWTAMPGAEWYQVQVGHWKPEFTSEDVFISECKAAVGSDQILVEVFNGTGKVINKDMMVNYYLTLEQIDPKTGKVLDVNTPVPGTNLDNSLLNTNATKDGWNDDAVIYVFNAPVNDNYNYNVKLMQGGVQMDIFSFGQAGAHLSRTAAVTRDADGMITKAATIKRNAGAFDQAAWETFHTSLPLAHYEWKDYTFFDMSDGGASGMIQKTSTTINNLKPNRNYDVRVIAYNDCIVDGDEVKIPISTQKINFLTMSEYTASEGDITFSDDQGWPTGNEPIGVSSVNVYTKDGKIFVSGAEGSVAIYNTMGARTVQATADAAKDGIAVNQGIYVVRVNNEKGITCVVK